jgi:hypothetical protein
VRVWPQMQRDGAWNRGGLPRAGMTAASSGALVAVQAVVHNLLLTKAPPPVHAHPLARAPRSASWTAASGRPPVPHEDLATVDPSALRRQQAECSDAAQHVDLGWPHPLASYRLSTAPRAAQTSTNLPKACLTRFQLRCTLAVEADKALAASSSCAVATASSGRFSSGQCR